MKMHLPHRSSFVTPASDLPVLRLGFRPFYLGASSGCSPCCLAWRAAWFCAGRPDDVIQRHPVPYARDDLRVCRSRRRWLSADGGAGLDLARNTIRRVVGPVIASVARGTHRGMVRPGAAGRDRVFGVSARPDDHPATRAHPGTQPPQYLCTRRAGHARPARFRPVARGSLECRVDRCRRPVLARGICTVRTSILTLADTSANRRQGGLKRNDVSTK